MNKLVWLSALLLLVGVTTRLWVLSWPAEVVFDEVHFGKFVSAYCCTHERFFDIHPPHAKLLIAGAVALTKYDGQFSFERIGQEYGGVPQMAFRAAPAVAGSLLPLVIFYLLIRLGVSVEASFLGGAAVALDNALIAQSRVIALDGVLLLSIFTSLLFIFLTREATGIRQWLLGGMTGVMAGLAAGSKFTGLIALGLVGLVMLVDLVRMVYRKDFSKVWRQIWLGVVVLAGFALVYLAGWAIHFALLTKAGPGDVWRVPSESFLREVIEWHRIMLSANYGLEAGHPDASPWWSWPLMLRPVFYWQGEGAEIHLIGNPIVWWGSMVLTLAGVLLAGRRGLTRRLGFWTVVAGWLMAILPLARVPRALFIYHYFTALVFAILMSVIFLDSWDGKRKKWLIGAVLLGLIAGWAVVSPVTYGWPTPGLWREVLRHLPRF